MDPHPTGQTSKMAEHLYYKLARLDRPPVCVHDPLPPADLRPRPMTDPVQPEIKKSEEDGKKVTEKNIVHQRQVLVCSLCAAHVQLECVHMWPRYAARYRNLVTSITLVAIVIAIVITIIIK